MPVSRREENSVRTWRTAAPVRTPAWRSLICYPVRPSCSPCVADFGSARLPREWALGSRTRRSAPGSRDPLLARLACCIYSVSAVTNSNFEARLKLVNIFYYSNQMHVHVHQCP
jgi:hypothetical protein